MQSAQERRLKHLQSVLSPNSGEQLLELTPVASGPKPRADDDVVVVLALRTPIAKAKRGAYKDTHPVDLLAPVLRAVVERSKIDPKLIGDIAVGNVLLPGAGSSVCRMAQFLAGLPEEVPVYSLNRQCSSGLQAFANVAGAIKNGVIDFGIAAGVESMSLGGDGSGSITSLSPNILENEKALECLNTMGQTSENVAKQFGVTRSKQDAFALASQQKALAAQKAGKFDQEILPITVQVKTANGKTETVVVSKDEGARPTTAEGLAKLKPAFAEDGTTTAGNASQVSDGAAAVLVARRSAAKKLGLPVLGTLRGYAVVGVPPAIMGIGPAHAIPEAVKKAGLTVGDIDVYEINEAFASQAVYCVEKLGIPFDKVNPNGGAIALGHPLGCTGARQISTLLYELHRRKARYGVVSMCIGTGMGAAAVFEADL